MSKAIALRLAAQRKPIHDRLRSRRVIEIEMKRARQETEVMVQRAEAYLKGHVEGLARWIME